MPIIKYKLMTDQNGERRILPKGFRGAFATKTVDGVDVYYGYIPSSVLSGLDDSIKTVMEIAQFSTLSDLVAELKPLFQYDEQGNARTDTQIENLVKAILNQYGITVDENGNLVG